MSSVVECFTYSANVLVSISMGACYPGHGSDAPVRTAHAILTWSFTFLKFMPGLQRQRRWLKIDKFVVSELMTTMKACSNDVSNRAGQMHQALFIPEILHDVCTHATDTTLVSLALSCKSFHETAIQALWNELCDLNPLIKCFPEDIWTIDQEHLVSEQPSARSLDVPSSLLNILGAENRSFSGA